MGSSNDRGEGEKGERERGGREREREGKETSIFLKRTHAVVA